jgi:dienelactone hydrolase
VIPIETRTLTDEAFRAGDKTAGASTEIAGVLRLPRLPIRQGPFPVVVLIEGSGGIGSNVDYWDRQFLSHGIATFTIDGFTGRGIESLVADQSKLGLMNMILDLYRGLGVLAKQPKVDANRIAVMGFSRGGFIALYSAMKRFQTAWNDSGVTPAAYIPLYPFCNLEFVDDADVAGGPIRIFHGEADDYVPIGPCQAYVQRLKQAGRDVEITALPGALPCLRHDRVAVEGHVPAERPEDRMYCRRGQDGGDAQPRDRQAVDGDRRVQRRRRASRLFGRSDRGHRQGCARLSRNRVQAEIAESLSAALQPPNGLVNVCKRASRAKRISRFLQDRATPSALRMGARL